MKQKWIPKAVLGAGIAMLSMLWAPVFRSFHLHQEGWLNETMAIVGSVALITTLYLLGGVGGWAAYTMAAVIAAGSAWVVGNFIAAEYHGPMSELLGYQWRPTAILIAGLYDVAVIGAAMANRKAEREAEDQANLEERLEAASLAQARAEKEAADLREQLKAAQVAAERRPSGRQTYAVRALEALQADEGRWLTTEELGDRLKTDADKLRAPLAKLEAGGKIARMTNGAGERIYAAMVAGQTPEPPAHVLRFKAGEVSS